METKEQNTQRRRVTGSTWIKKKPGITAIIIKDGCRPPKFSESMMGADVWQKKVKKGGKK